MNEAVCAGPGQAGARRVPRVSGLTSLCPSLLFFLSLSLSLCLRDNDNHVKRPVLYWIFLWLNFDVVGVPDGRPRLLPGDAASRGAKAVPVFCIFLVMFIGHDKP